MSECVILYRVNDRLKYVPDPEDPGEFAIFPDLDAAIAYCDTNKLFRSGQLDHQIVELDEL
jgi:hypothetical protein